MQRHPVAQTVTHVDFVIVRRDEVISADVPIILVGEAIEVHHGDGLVDQQMFTLAINALPTAIPSAIEADVSALIIGGQVRVSELALPTGVTTDVDPETAVAIGQPPRVVTEEETGEGEGEEGAEAPPGQSRVETRRPRRAAKRARPCAAPLPGRSTGGHRRTCSSSGWETPEGIRREPAQRGSDTGRAAGRAPRRVVAGGEGRARPGRRGEPGRTPGGPRRPDHVHERLRVVRACAGHALRDRRARSIVIVHDELDLPPGTVRLKAGGGLAGHNGLRSVQSHLHSPDFLRVRIGIGQAPERGRGCVARPAPAPQGGPRAPGRIGADGRRTPSSTSLRRHGRRHVVVSLAADLIDDVRPSDRPNPRRPRPAGLAAVPRLLRSDAVLSVLVGAADATVAVPAAAQAVVAAALAAFTERSPLLVVTATGLDAERLGDDLSCLVAPEGDDADAPVVGALAGPVTVLPAWETLPFERVSPETETMGRRLAVLHALTGAADPVLPPTPRVIVAPVRAILQRLGPLQGTAPWSYARGNRSMLPSSCPNWWRWATARAPGGAPRGVRRARGHRRRVPLDGRRARPHRPLGDEVDA